MMGLDMPETCRGWRNILRIICFFFTRLVLQCLQLGAHNITIKNILKKSQILQALKNSNFGRNQINRSTLKSWIWKSGTGCHRRGRQFWGQVVFTHETSCYGKRHMNWYNCCACGEEWPHEFDEHLWDSLIFNVWCGIIREFVTGRLFFAENITANMYVYM